MESETYEANYARIGKALDELASIDGVDFKPNIDVQGCYRSDEYTMFEVEIVVDDAVLDDVEE